jgi:PIN domain nuclease of toxin-antitoxin system
VILLDTNAIIWMHTRHRRARALDDGRRLYASPASVLELQLLVESGRLRLQRGATAHQLVQDDRWLIDAPPSADWFDVATEEGWTRDPFDRLIIAHARLRGWKLATGDSDMAQQLGPTRTVAL